MNAIRRVCAACCLWMYPAYVMAALPTVMSTNLCADIMALSLADERQLLSVSHKSRDPRLSLLSAAAAAFPSNKGLAEEVVALRPDVVLASRRWAGGLQRELFSRHSIAVEVLSFPADWDEIFENLRRTGNRLQREARAEELIADVRQRIAQLHRTQRPFKALYLRPNGGCAGSGTYVDTVLQAVGVRNHAATVGCSGWGKVSLERLLMAPPDVFIVGDMPQDTAYARSTFSRHPLMRQLLAERPVIHVSSRYWGCSNWLLIEAAEEIAAQLDSLPEGAQP